MPHKELLPVLLVFGKRSYALWKAMGANTEAGHSPATQKEVQMSRSDLFFQLCPTFRHVY